MTEISGADSRISELNELAMKYETSVMCFSAENYLEEFYDFFEIRNRDNEIKADSEGFHDSLKEVCGYDVWQPIAEKAESLFGLPEKIFIFSDASSIIEEMEGPDGLGPFFFIFDILFCEYEDITLCFISGTNN